MIGIDPQPTDLGDLAADLSTWQEAVAGTKRVTAVPLAELGDGTKISLSVIVISGTLPGPTLYVGGGIHGDEVGAVAIVQRVIGEVDPQALRGRVICVPVQNPVALQMNHRLALQFVLRSPLDQSPGDPWLEFPGHHDGNAGQAIAASLFALMTTADAVVDVHTPTTGGRYVPFAFVPPASGGAVARRSLELALAFSPDFILNARKGIYVQDGTPHVELARHGIPAFGFEIGEGGRVDVECVARGWHCVRNLMQHLEMVDGQTAAPEPSPRIISSMTPVRARRGGLLTCSAALGAEVQENESIGRVTAPWGECVDEIVSPHAGPLMRLTTFGAVAASDRIAQIGVEECARSDSSCADALSGPKG